MSQPTIIEFRTATAILRQEREREQANLPPNKALVESLLLAERTFANQFQEMLLREELVRPATPAATKEHYLGDGVYARHDGFQIWLRADRNGQSHEVAIDNDTWIALVAYVHNRRWEK